MSEEVRGSAAKGIVTAQACFQGNFERLPAFHVTLKRTRKVQVWFNDPNGASQGKLFDIDIGTTWSSLSNLLNSHFLREVVILYSDENRRVETEGDFQIFCYWAERRILNSNETHVVATVLDKNPPEDLVVTFVDKISESEKHSFVFNISWGITWSDVLDELKYQFGRAVIFEYNCKNVDRNGELVSSEKDFDEFCSWAEKLLQKSKDARIEAHIRNATFKPSTEEKWEELQYSTILKTLPWQEEAQPPAHSGVKQLPPHDDVAQHGSSVGAGGATDEGAGDGLPRRFPPAGDWRQLLRVLDRAPVPPEYMWLFGVSGLVATTAGGAVAYAYDINTVGAVTIALPWNLFLISLFVSEVEEGYLAVFRFGVAFAGVACAAISTSRP